MITDEGEEDVEGGGIYHSKCSKNKKGDEGQAFISALVTDVASIVDRWVSIQNNYRKDGHFDAVSYAQSGRVSEIADIAVESMTLSHYQEKNELINNIAYSPAREVSNFRFVDLVNFREMLISNDKSKTPSTSSCSTSGCERGYGGSYELDAADIDTYAFRLLEKNDTVSLRRNSQGEWFPVLSVGDMVRVGQGKEFFVPESLNEQGRLQSAKISTASGPSRFYVTGQGLKKILDDKGNIGICVKCGNEISIGE